MQGATPTLSEYAVKRAYLTMNGNPRELRKFAGIIAVDEGELEAKLNKSMPDAETEQQLRQHQGNH